MTDKTSRTKQQYRNRGLEQYYKPARSGWGHSPFQPSPTSLHPSEMAFGCEGWAGRTRGPGSAGGNRLVGSYGPQGPSCSQWPRVGPSAWPLLSYQSPSHLPGPQGALFLSTLDLCLCQFLCLEFPSPRSCRSGFPGLRLCSLQPLKAAASEGTPSPGKASR